MRVLGVSMKRIIFTTYEVIKSGIDLV